jgi:hypothetical protein
MFLKFQLRSQTFDEIYQLIGLLTKKTSNQIEDFLNFLGPS